MIQFSWFHAMIREDKAIKFFKLAKFQAELFSKDPSTKVCAIIINPESLEIKTCGFNGFPRHINENISSRWERPCKYSWVEHSERNALYNACRNGVCLNGSCCIVTMFPCCDCARGLIQSGITQVVTVKPDMDNPRWANDFSISLQMFTEAGVEIMYVKEDEQNLSQEVIKSNVLGTAKELPRDDLRKAACKGPDLSEHGAP